MISFLIVSFISKRKRAITTENHSLGLSLRIAYILLLIAAIYTVASYTLHISIIGTYTDFVLGVIIFTYTDYILIIIHPDVSFAKHYKTGRKLYITYNVFRCAAYGLIGIATMGEPCITFPAENMNRTKDRIVFDKYYINSSYYRTFDEFRHITTISKKFWLFKIRVHKPNAEVGGQDLTHTGINYIGADSAVILGLGANAIIFRHSGNYYYTDLFEGPQKLD